MCDYCIKSERAVVSLLSALDRTEWNFRDSINQHPDMIENLEENRSARKSAYKLYPGRCVCHEGSVCTDICKISHHVGCGYEG